MKSTLRTSDGRSYDIVKKLGSGGMADVFLVRDESAGLLVAAKVLPQGSWDRPEAIERFRREALTSDRLRHRNIIGIRDVALDGQPPFFVMDFAPGGSLAERIRKSPEGLDPAFIRTVARQVLLALDHAHRHRVVHRDIKPENILFDAADSVLVSDFGLARILDDKTLTREGALLGTPYYNSPELARGHKIYDGRCDLYSLGVVLYEMATGRVPFDGIDAVAVCHRHVFEPPAPPRSLRPDLDPELEKLILKALEKKPGDRYQSAADMLADLEALERGESLVYDPLPGVFALLEHPEGDETGASGLERPWRERTFLARFLFGTAENPPEPAAGLLVGAFLALVVWTGLSALGSATTPASPANLSTAALLEVKPGAATALAQPQSAKLPATTPIPGRILLFPLEDRSGRADLARVVEEAMGRALTSAGSAIVPSRDVVEWQSKRSLSFSALFRPDHLATLKSTFGATHFATGILLRSEGTGTTGPLRLEVELAVYRFDDRRNLGTLRDTVTVPPDADASATLTAWLGGRLAFVLRGA